MDWHTTAFTVHSDLGPLVYIDTELGALTGAYALAQILSFFFQLECDGTAS